MKETLEFILKRIVSQPDKVEIEEEMSPESNLVTLKINSAEEDKGLIIGKSGRIINSLRNIINIKAVQENKRVYLKIVDDKEEKEA